MSFVSFLAVSVVRAIRAEEGPETPAATATCSTHESTTHRGGRGRGGQAGKRECQHLPRWEQLTRARDSYSRRSLVTMQASLMVIGCLLLALYCPPTCALISRSRFSRPSTLGAPLDCKQTPRSMVTSLATAQLNQPEPPAVKSPVDVGQLAMLALMVVFLIIQMSQGAAMDVMVKTQVSQGAAMDAQGAAMDVMVKMQVSQGAAIDAVIKTQASQAQMLTAQSQTLTALSTKFDQVSYFVVGVIALATFGSSVVKILEYRDGIEKKKELRGRE